VLRSDALSSVAYGPEAMPAVLVLGGHRALGLPLPVAGAIALLMVAVGALLPPDDPFVSGWRGRFTGHLQAATRWLSSRRSVEAPAARDTPTAASPSGKRNRMRFVR
jgi:hypothetical protein